MLAAPRWEATERFRGYTDGQRRPHGADQDAGHGPGGLAPARARQDDEALHVVPPLDDLHTQRRHLCHRSVNLPGVVAAIGPDQFEPREAPAYLVEDEPAPSRSWIRGLPAKLLRLSDSLALSWISHRPSRQ